MVEGEKNDNPDKNNPEKIRTFQSGGRGDTEDSSKSWPFAAEGGETPQYWHGESG
jgi:hypothetical protein